MADVFDPQKRSEVMSKIRGKNTRAEKIVFLYLRKEKIYFQKYYKKAPGKPEVALPRRKKAVFIDGDFWHGKTYDQLKLRRPPGDYWLIKIAKNMERDKEQEKQLLEKGWKILRIWEKDVLTKRLQPQTLESIKEFLLHTQ